MSPPNLTRNVRERCVMARVMRAGQKHQANFFLWKHDGDWERTEVAAQEWLTALLGKLPPPTSNEGRLSRRNTSGEVGVTLTRKKHRPKGRQARNYFSWTARWPGCPLNGGISWSWQRFGDAAAYVLAVLSRRMRTTYREDVIERWQAIQGTEEYRAILAQWSR